MVTIETHTQKKARDRIVCLWIPITKKDLDGEWWGWGVGVRGAFPRGLYCCILLPGGMVGLDVDPTAIGELIVL